MLTHLNNPTWHFIGVSKIIVTIFSFSKFQNKSWQVIKKIFLLQKISHKSRQQGTPIYLWLSSWFPHPMPTPQIIFSKLFLHIPTILHFLRPRNLYFPRSPQQSNKNVRLISILCANNCSKHLAWISSFNFKITW